ncbi:MAG TPA: hypothetical protein VL551_04010 [Actinospica sp.]|nr:hypothetical protein [Actinospica sp.]
MSLTKLRNRKVVDEPGFPPPLNAHRARDRVWDKAEIAAYAAGRPRPERPAPSADDLLDDAEAAHEVGVSVETFVQQTQLMSAQPQSIAAHDLRYWRRGDLVRRHESPPGRVGKPAGTKDLAPRRRRGGPPPIAAAAAARVDELATYLAQLADDGKQRPRASELAAHFDVTTQTIRRWLARIDHDPASPGSGG